MAKYMQSSEWWSARRGTRPAARSAFAGLVEDNERSGGWLRVANRGDLVFLSRGGALLGEGFTVYTGSIACPAPNPITGEQGPCSGTASLKSVEAPAGAFRCDDAAFGTSGWRTPCYVKKSDVSFEPPPGTAAHVADQGQGFHTDASGVVYYGEKGRGPYVPRLVDPGAYVCNNANFGPDPAWGRVKECLLAAHVAVEEGAPITYYDDLARQLDAQQRAQAAAQAQRDMEAAQTLVFAQQNADQAAQDAQTAQNAQAQAAAALAAAEQYRQMQADAHKQAADYAAQLALLAAQNAADSDAAMAAANATAQAEALRQALAQAQADQAQQQAAYDMANAATQVEMRNQEQANARVTAAQNAAEQQAANAAAGGAASPFANLSTTELLMYGGIAAAAIYLLMGEKKKKA